MGTLKNLGDLSDLQIMGFIFVCVFGSALIAFWLRQSLKEHYLSDQTQDVVKVTTGVIASVAALVLGLLVASAKQSFDAKAVEVQSIIINATLLDRSMKHYEPSLDAERQLLGDSLKGLKARLWGSSVNATLADPLGKLDLARDTFRSLNPQSDAQKFQQSRFLSLSDTLLYVGNQLIQGSEQSVPLALVAVVVVWLSMIFFGFGLFAPFNAASLITLACGASAISMAILLIVTMSDPFSGVIMISEQGFDSAIAQIAAK